MTGILRMGAILFAVSAGALSAQESAAAQADTTEDPHAVTAYAVRSGKLMLSSKANPKPTVLPDGIVRRISSIAWVDEEAWCSEPVRLSPNITLDSFLLFG